MKKKTNHTPTETYADATGRPVYLSGGKSTAPAAERLRAATLEAEYARARVRALSHRSRVDDEGRRIFVVNPDGNRATRRSKNRLRGPGYTRPDRTPPPPKGKRARARKAYFAAVVARRRARSLASVRLDSAFGKAFGTRTGRVSWR